MTTTVEGDGTMTNGTTKRLFYPGKYYVVTEDNKVILEANSMTEARQPGLAETDTILIAVSAQLVSKPVKTVEKVKEIVFDFDKKLLTIDGDSATLDGTTYLKGSTELEDGEITNWCKTYKDASNTADRVIIIGTPPIKGRNITNEMSDL